MRVTGTAFQDCCLIYACFNVGDENAMSKRFMGGGL